MMALVMLKALNNSDDTKKQRKNCEKPSTILMDWCSTWIIHIKLFINFSFQQKPKSLKAPLAR